MTEDARDHSPLPREPLPQRSLPRRPLWPRTPTAFLVALLLLIGAFAGTVLALNATVFSATGFAASYLNALQRHDIDTAVAVAGVQSPDDGATTLLTRDAMPDLTGYELVSNDQEPSGERRLVYRVHFAGQDPVDAVFLIRHEDARMGFFSAWSFARSPLGTLEVTPQHESRFEVNGVPVQGEAGLPTALHVLTPGAFQITHTSTYLHAEPVTVVMGDAAAAVEATIDIQAGEEFVRQVNEELAAYLDECATQTVLFPAGCPFGQPIDARLVSEPQWSMVAYPQVTIVPAPEAGTWWVPPTPAMAHLIVEVRSLFDGARSTFDADVPFDVEYEITFPGDGRLLISPR